MIIKKLVIYLMIASLFPAFSFAAENYVKKDISAGTNPAETNLPITLSNAFKAALRRSEVLATQQELVTQAEENYKRAWGAILPSVSASYSYLRQENNTTARAQASAISFDQPLFRGFRDFAAVDATMATITAQKQAKDWAGMQLYSDVASAFYTYLSAQKDIYVLDKELNLYSKRIAELQERQKIGRTRSSEVLTVQSARAILKAQREQILGQLGVAKEVFSFLTGLDGELTLDDKDPVPSSVDSLENYQSKIDTRPDVSAAIKNVEASKSGVKIAKGAHLPSADLLGNYYTQHPDTRQGGDWDAQISVTMPIFSGGIISSNVRTAESQKRENEFLLSQIKRLAKEDIRSLHHSLESSLTQITALQDAFNISQQNYQANLKDYEFGLVTNLDVLQALTAYQETERSLEKSRYLAKINYNQLEAAVANRLTLMKSQEKQ
jgi:outer membrane protein